MGITPFPRRASAIRPHGGHLQLLYKKVLQLLGNGGELAIPHGTEDLGAEQMEELQVGQLQHSVRRLKEGIRRRLLRQQHQIAQAKGYIDLPAEELLQRCPVSAEQDDFRRIAGRGIHSTDELLRPGRHYLRLELEPLGVIP